MYITYTSSSALFFGITIILSYYIVPPNGQIYIYSIGIIKNFFNARYIE